MCSETDRQLSIAKLSNGSAGDDAFTIFSYKHFCSYCYLWRLIYLEES